MNKIFSIKTLALSLCLLGVLTGFSQLSGYSYHKVLTIQNTQVIGSGSHANFPILISELDANLATVANGGKVQNNNGYDIKFTASDGTTLLEHQIELYNPLTGRFIAWVKIPSLSTSTNTVIKMHYGSPLGVTDPSIETVWDANYKAVYHFTNDFVDKTVNNNDFTNFGASSNPTGAAARSINFSPSNYLEAPANLAHQINGNLTLSTWLDMNSVIAGNYENCLISCSGIGVVGSENVLYSFNVEDDGRLRILWNYGSGVVEEVLSTNPITFTSGYTMLSVVRNSTPNEITFYQDGIPIDAGPLTYANNATGGTNATLRLGVNQKNPGYELDAEQDEVRISNNLRSAAWLRTEFNAINSPSTFYTSGPQIIACNAGFSYASPTYCVTIDPNPSPTVTGDVGGFFTGSPAGITVNGSTGSIDLAISMPGVYTVTYTAPNLCQSNVTVTLNGADDASFSYSASNFCQGDSDPVATISGTTGGVFTIPAALAPLDFNTGEFDVSAATPGGPYTITYTSPGPDCPVSSDFMVDIFAEDDPTFNYPQAAYCQEDADPSPIISGTSGGTFSGPAQVTIDANTGVIDLSASTSGGPYVITYLTPGPNCPNSSTFNITINAEDDPSFNYSTANYCITGANQSPASISTLGGTFSEITGNLNVNSSTGLVDFTSSTAGNYYVVYTTSGICPNIDSVNFILENIQDPNFNYLSPICITGSNPTPSSITTPGGIFVESGPNLNFINSTTGEIDLSTTLAGTYTIDYTCPGVCANTSNQIIEVLPPIDPVFSLPDTICLPSAILDLSTTANTQTWETSNFYSYGPNGSVNLSGSINELLDPNLTSPGLYNVTHVVDNGGCLDSSTLVVEIFQDYESNYFDIDTLCAGYGIYDLSNLYLAGLTSAGGVWTGASITNDSIWDMSSALGDYLITYIVGEGQCADATTKTIHILPDLDSSWVIPGPFCLADATIDLTNSITGTSGGTWTGTGTSANIFDPLVAGTGNHPVTYYVGTPACNESLTLSIIVVDNPTADAGLDSTACGLTYNLQAVDSGLPSHWTTSEQVIYSPDSSAANNQITASSYGIKTFYWNVGSGACSSQDSVIITFFEEPLADAGMDIILNFRFATSLAAVTPNSGQGIWSTLEGAEIDDIYNPNTDVSELNEGDNVFTWTVSNGPCPTQKDDVVVTVNTIYIPEGLTPNNDGKNDLFVVDGIEEIPNKVIILNRWGQTVFEADNYQNDWSGIDNKGKALNPDTYFYIIEIDQTFTYKGFIVLKR